MKEDKPKKEIRLDKYLADMGIGSRSQVKTMIRKNQIQVNGQNVKKADLKIDMLLDEVAVNDQKITYTAMEYFMLNKPAGVVSATRDINEKTVLDLLITKQRKDLFPVGRLDKDTEGLLLITNDGELTHLLLSPKKHVDKKYLAKISGVATLDDVETFRKGLDIGDEKQTLPAELEILSTGEFSEVLVTVREGRFHQIKRMFEAVDKSVVYLKRLSMGTLELDDTLQPGEYRKLTEQEIERLKNANAEK